MTSKEPNTVITHSSVCALFYPSATEIAGSNSSQDINVFPRFYCLCFVPFTLKVWNGLIPQAWSPTRYLWTKFSPDLFYLLFAGAEGYCCTWLHSMTHTHTHTWTKDRPVGETSTRRTLNIYKRQTSMPPAVLEPAIPTNKRPQTYALNQCDRWNKIHHHHHHLPPWIRSRFKTLKTRKTQGPWPCCPVNAMNECGNLLIPLIHSRC